MELMAPSPEGKGQSGKKMQLVHEEKERNGLSRTIVLLLLHFEAG